jgi:hypothetical protein
VYGYGTGKGSSSATGNFSYKKKQWRPPSIKETRGENLFKPEE